MMNILRIGRYRVLQRLGSGASSDVYLSEDSMLKRKVALKVLRRRDADDRQIRCFEREVQCASLLNHPNIITVFDIGRDNDVQYIAMEHIDGETLRERIGQGPMTSAESVDVAIAIASALVTAHEAWVIHRDIKPENIMIRRDGVVKVVDFGVAALFGDGDRTDPLRRSGPLAGTLAYLSPEQVRADPIIDTRADIYSLGVVLFEMLSGKQPFTGPSVMDILAAIVEKEPTPLPAIVPQALRSIVERALRKNIYERQQTASEILAQLGEVRLDLLMRERSARNAG